MDIPPPDDLFPAYVSIKHNGMMGCAMVTEAGDPIWRSYSQEDIRMAPQIETMFQDILECAQEQEIVMVGEFNSSEYNKAGQTLSILAGTMPCPDDFAFKCFYEVPYSVWNGRQEAHMEDLLAKQRNYLDNYQQVTQHYYESYERYQQLRESTKNSNLEGYMLLNPRAKWRRGRATVNDCILFKDKYYSDPIDAVILDIEPRQQLKAGLSSRRNPAGYTKRLHGQDNYEHTKIGGKLICRTRGGQIVSTPFPVNTPLDERAMYYRNKGTGNKFDLLGRWISFCKLAVEDGAGAVSVKGVEFRDNPEEYNANED
jgi:hypothetical protein